jgi:hypothetical protein
MRTFGAVLGLFGLLVLLPMESSADVVHLKGGGTIEGIVRAYGDEITVEMDMGTVSVPKSEVASIESSDSNLKILKARWQGLNRSDASAHFELAQWASRQGLASQARALYRETLAIDREHVGAHQALGDRLHEGRWMNEDEYMQATGHIQVGGRWLTESAYRAELARQTAESAERTALAKSQALESERKSQTPPEPAKRTRSDDDQNGFLWSNGWYGWPIYGPRRPHHSGRIGQPTPQTPSKPAPGRTAAPKAPPSSQGTQKMTSSPHGGGTVVRRVP